MIQIVLSNTSGVPIYQQLFDQVSAQIIKGELESGSALPPIRTTAKELRVSIITIKKAWEMLERDGFICTVVGRGSFIAPLSLTELTDKRDDLVREKMVKDIEYYKRLGLTLEELTEAITRMY